MSGEPELVYSFSSNQSPLYIQDVLDLLALPLGARHQFRYFDKWIEETARMQWAHLEGRQILLHFAIQQLARFHQPAFIPIRLGTVRRTERVGSIYVLEFELGGYVALQRTSTKSDKARDIYGPSVQDYDSHLASLKIKRPYDAWVSLGPSALGGMDCASDQMQLFERVTEFLSQTESFRRARYYRVISLRESGRSATYMSDPSDVLPSEGKFRLDGGVTYELTLAHTQPAEIQEREEFTVSADDGILRVIGRKNFEISSRYDLIRIFLHAVHPPTSEPRETVLAIDPAVGVQGPRLRMRTEIRANPARTAVGVAGSVAGAVLLGIPSLQPTLEPSLKFLCVGLAAALIAWLTTMGLRRT